MKAAVYRGRNDIRIENVPVPVPAAEQILVKVALCGVCPTDIKKIQAGTVPPPRIFGHETAGTIVRLGRGVRGFRVGDRVGLHHHVPCRKCHFCRHHAFAQCPQYKRTGITAGFEPAGGGFAEYVCVSDFCLPGVVKLPKSVSFLQGAMLEPVNAVLKGVEQLGVRRGDTVLVCGQGPIGLMFTRVLFRKGIKVLATDLIPERVAFGRRFGAKWAGAPDELSSHGSTDGPIDAAVVTVPVDSAVQEAHRLIRGAGKVLVFGHTAKGRMVGFDLGVVCVDEKAIVGSYSSDIRLQPEAARFCFRERLFLEALATDFQPLARTVAAIEAASSPEGARLKVLVAPAAETGGVACLVSGPKSGVKNA